ncbi:MAG: UDP-3-O-(3-hydroxymyristoyl)glucosamine N-acyltransferase [Pseudomonadota bacterium]
MTDLRFFQREGPLALHRIAEIAGGELRGADSPNREMSDVAPLDTATEEQVSFLDNRKYLDQLAETKAGACILAEDVVDQAPQGMALIVCPKPYMGYAKVAQAFYPTPHVRPGIHPAAVIHESAIIDDTASIGACAVIEAGASVGPRTEISPNAVVGANVEIGEACIIGANASLSHCFIGDRVHIYPGVRIGQNGFGFAFDSSGHVRVPQLGRVIVHDDVEIGANCTIDRGAGPDTVIGKGVMIDNLVQIAHNVKIGQGAVIIAQAGIAGSASLGRWSVVAAQSGVAGHLTIGDGARIGAQSGVMRDVPAGEDVLGSPAMQVRAFWRQMSQLAKLGRPPERPLQSESED